MRVVKSLRCRHGTMQKPRRRRTEQREVRPRLLVAAHSSMPPTIILFFAHIVRRTRGPGQAWCVTRASLCSAKATQENIPPPSSTRQPKKTGVFHGQNASIAAYIYTPHENTITDPPPSPRPPPPPPPLPPSPPSFSPANPKSRGSFTPPLFSSRTRQACP